MRVMELRQCTLVSRCARGNTLLSYSPPFSFQAESAEYKYPAIWAESVYSKQHSKDSASHRGIGMDREPIQLKPFLCKQSPPARAENPAQAGFRSHRNDSTRVDIRLVKYLLD